MSMKRATLLNAVLVAIFLLSVTFSAHLTTDANIDSLRKVWEGTRVHDTLRIAALYDMARDGYLYSDPDYV